MKIPLDQLRNEVKGKKMKIERNVPLPEHISSRINIGPLPLKEMEVGDSFFLSCSEEQINKMLTSLRVRLSRFTQNHPDFKFSSTKEGKGIRVWRV